MSTNDFVDVSLRGQIVRTPVVWVRGLPVIVTGSVLRIASVHDAIFADRDTLVELTELREQLAARRLKADIVTFAQRVYESHPKYPYPYEWDNAAVARAASYEDWWMSLPQESRKNVRRATRRGVRVDAVRFDDALVRGIKELYDETPLRQGRPFWHYGKSLDRIKLDNSSYLDRSEFIAAYHADKLIGFMKFVYAGELAVIMQILALSSEQDKRPMNAMIAKAMEVCHAKGVSFLVYSKFTFGNKTRDDMGEFKRRNGFVRMDYPRYYVPLTIRGRVALATNAHRGLLGVLPSGAIEVILKIRAMVLNGFEGARSGTKAIAPDMTHTADV